MGNRHSVTLIPGDGTGPELIDATVKVLEAAGVSFTWRRADVGAGAFERLGDPLPAASLEAVRTGDAALKGPTSTPRSGAIFRSANVGLRLALGLYATVRPCKTFAGVRTPFSDVDIVVASENTEDKSGGGQYAPGSPAALALIEALRSAEGNSLPENAAVGLAYTSEAGTRRFARLVFDYARRNRRKKVTISVKGSGANYVDATFLSVAREVAQEFPDIECDYEVIDTLCLQLVRRPQHFDVLLLPGSYGDLLSDLCAGLVGGIGLASGSLFGDGVAVFEAAHGSAPKHAGLNKVNPMALILSGALMLRHLGEAEAADRVQAAVAAQIREGRCLTYDLAPSSEAVAGTREVADAVARRVRG